MTSAWNIGGATKSIPPSVHSCQRPSACSVCVSANNQASARLASTQALPDFFVTFVSQLTNHGFGIEYLAGPGPYLLPQFPHLLNEGSSAPRFHVPFSCIQLLSRFIIMFGQRLAEEFIWVYRFNAWFARGCCLLEIIPFWSGFVTDNSILPAITGQVSPLNEKLVAQFFSRQLASPNPSAHGFRIASAFFSRLPDAD